MTPDGEITILMKMVYSGADPRLELLQTVAGTVWTPADSGVHHIGYWSDDVESDLASTRIQRHDLRSQVLQPRRVGDTSVGIREGADRTTQSNWSAAAWNPFIAYWWSTAGGSRSDAPDDRGFDLAGRATKTRRSAIASANFCSV